MKSLGLGQSMHIGCSGKQLNWPAKESLRKLRSCRKWNGRVQGKVSLCFLIRCLITDECHDSVSEVQDMELGGIPEFYDRGAVMHA
jgi:hypothetical protein